MTSANTHTRGNSNTLADLNDPLYNFDVPSYDEWFKAAIAGLGVDSGLDQLAKKTLDNVRIEVLYAQYPNTQTGAPLPFPLATTTSGNSEDKIGWDNRLSIRDNNASAVNQRLLRGLSGGNTSVELYLNNAHDLPNYLAGVALDIASVHLRSMTDTTYLVDALLQCCAARNIAPDSLRCSFNIDPVGYALKGLAAASTIESGLNNLSQSCQLVIQHFPTAQSLLVDVTPHHNAGASTQQELYAAIATAALYLETLINKGWSLHAAQQQIVFQLACDADILMNSVKLRALKQLWSHLLSAMAKQLQTDNNTYSSPQIVVETSQRYLSFTDPWNNHLRNIAACAAAAFNQATAIIVHPHDEIDGHCLSENPIDGERIARNLPIILERESMLTAVQDPMAGSYAVESLTDEYCRITWDSIKQLNSTHDWLDQLTKGSWHKSINSMHSKRLQLMQDEANIAVGVNRFINPNEAIRSSSTITDRQAKSDIHLLPVRDAAPFEAQRAAHAQTESDA